ncbi:MAG: hypothetical protein ACOCWB_01760 [Bacteroidota bacterium]
MKKILINSVFICAIGVCSIHAQNENVNVYGFAELDHFSFFEQNAHEINTRNQSIVQLDLQSKLSEQFSMRSLIEFRNDLSNSARNRAYLKESYIDIRNDSFDTRIGKQVIQWGIGDGFSPMRAFAPLDYSDILDTEDEYIGIFALYSQWHKDSWTIHGMVSPLFTPSILPNQYSRWRMNLPSHIPIEGNLMPAQYSLESSIMPPDKIEHGSFALKVDKRFSLVDVSAAYYSGYNVVPEVQTTIDTITMENVLLNIQPNYYRHQILSLNIVVALQKYILRAEGGLFIPQDIPVDNPYFQYVVGMERLFGNLIGTNSLLMNIQWIQEISQKGIEYSNKNFNHLFQKNIMTRFEFQTNKNFDIVFQGMYSIDYQDYYIQPGITYNIADGLNATLHVDVLGGEAEKNGFFSAYSHNNRVQAKFTYNF